MPSLKSSFIESWRSQRPDTYARADDRGRHGEANIYNDGNTVLFNAHVPSRGPRNNPSFTPAQVALPTPISLATGSTWKCRWEVYKCDDGPRCLRSGGKNMVRSTSDAVRSDPGLFIDKRGETYSSRPRFMVAYVAWHVFLRLSPDILYCSAGTKSCLAENVVSAPRMQGKRLSNTNTEVTDELTPTCIFFLE